MPPLLKIKCVCWPLWRFGLVLLSLTLCTRLHADPPGLIEKGVAVFAPSLASKTNPERYLLEAHDFDWVLRPKRNLPLSGLDIFDLQFPSPIKSLHEENNTVHAEYYRPIGAGPFPGVIVLDITGGDQELSRIIARNFAQNGVAGLFVQMAYYGPRRPPNSKLRLLSTDLEHTKAAVRQTVLDLRYATAWMEGRPELDKKRLGIVGTSLGSFMAALTAEMEPKLSRVAVLLGGGGFVDAYWEHPQVLPYRKTFELLGGKKEFVKEMIAPIDPLTCADRLKDRRLLIIAAKKDEIVPPRMAENLWEASGRQRIVWLNAGHYSAALYLLPGLHIVVDHFRNE